MKPLLGRWEHSREAVDGLEQRGYDLIGGMIRRRRWAASLTQRQLERAVGIDQTVISRLENGKQYGLRWSKFAILVGVLDGLDDSPDERLVPWWVKAGIRPPAHMHETLREQGLLPVEFDVVDPEEQGDI